MPKSNASRLLRAMASCGMLETVGDSKRYRPGLLLHDAGRHYRLTNPFLRSVEEAAARAARRLGAGAIVSVVERDAGQVAIVSEFDANGMLVERLPAPRSCVSQRAGGLALIARLSDETVAGMLAGVDSAMTTQAMDCLRLARRRGFAIFDQDGRVEVAVAVGDASQLKEAAVCVAVPSDSAASWRVEAARSMHEQLVTIAASARDTSFKPFAPEAA